MKKSVKRALTVCGAAAMMLSAAQITAFADGDVKEVSLHLPTVYDLPDAPMVEDAINQITEEKYGIHLNLTYVTMGNWQQQSNLLFTSDEADVIAVFQTPLSTYVKNGQLVDLTDYYANASDEFKQVWSEEEMKGTTVDGKIYAVPNLRNFGNIIGLNIDADIAAEFGIENGQKLTMEEIDEFLTKAHEKYPDRYALVPQSSDSMVNGWTWDGLGDEKYIGVLEDQGQSTEVKNLFETDDFVDFCTWTRKWYQDGFTMQDVLSNTQPFQTLIGNDQAIACFDNYAVNNVAGMIRTEVVSAWAQSNSYQALCYGINVNSKDTDAAWELMQILYTDKDVCTLLADGIEGTHYTVNDDGTISFVDDTHGGYMPWRNGMGNVRILPPTADEGVTYWDDFSAYYNSAEALPYGGFIFDNSPVSTEGAALANVYAEYAFNLMSGAVNPDTVLPEFLSKMESAGIDAFVAEANSQLNAYLGK